MTNCDQLWPTVTNCDKPWPTVTNRDQPWPTVTNCDQPWPTVTNCDQSWPTTTNCDQLWSTVTNRDQLWSTVTNCDQLWQPWPTVTNCDQLWPTVTNCDQLWPTVINRDQLWPTPVRKAVSLATTFLWIYTSCELNRTSNECSKLHLWQYKIRIFDANLKTIKYNCNIPSFERRSYQERKGRKKTSSKEAEEKKIGVEKNETFSWPHSLSLIVPFSWPRSLSLIVPLTEPRQFLYPKTFSSSSPAPLYKNREDGCHRFPRKLVNFYKIGRHVVTPFLVNTAGTSYNIDIVRNSACLKMLAFNFARLWSVRH